MALADKTLVCSDCGKEFTFSAGEQEFYTSRGLQNDPKRCPQCRAARRERRGSETGTTRQAYSTVCATCGAETTVPFEPTAGRPVYCRECYAKAKQT